ncbi:general transcription factor IIH subunit 5 [Alosa sapidissima]|uniref:general transcription factor IIH subunit 5 n=1 Tax=Alosa sapidissima TaxID=34773 RepID=UPI001C0A1F21|nr:general transcription factor IIH subunit 5 [Alosa sapidissima]
MLFGRMFYTTLSLNTLLFTPVLHYSTRASLPLLDCFACTVTTLFRENIVVKMVNVLKGVLVECDPAMKQFLLYLDETSALGKKFIIQDLDDTHVFILAEVVQILQERVGELMDQNSFPITQK